jgi:PAS domain S-box-containing protein
VRLKTDRSVQSTLRRIMMATTASALLLACVAFVAFDFVSAHQTIESDLGSLASVIGANSAAALTFGDREAAGAVLAALQERPSVVAACLYNERGERFQAYALNGNNKIIPDTAPPPGTARTGMHFSVTRRVMFDGKQIGTIFVASDLHEFLSRMKRYGVLAVSILFVSLLAALGVSSALQSIISEPILRLAEVADSVRRERNYAIRVGAPYAAPDEIAVLFAAFDDMLAETQLRNEELRRQQIDLECLVQARTAELRAANGELVLAHDRAQRNADANARLSHHRQAILDATVEGIFGLDERGLATFINTSAARILGYSQEELIGRSLHGLIHPEEDDLSLDDCAVCSSTLQPSLRSGSNGVFVSSDGRRIPVDYTTTAMPSDGTDARGVVVTFRDITERREVERMKDEFVSTVSHELRTPMTSIRGALGLLSSGLMGAVTPAAKQLLSIAVGNTDRLTRLINDILDLEKMSSGRVELNPAVTSSVDISVEAIDGVRVVADKAGVRILSEVTSEALWIDRDRIVQTLTNLLGNAIKFSPAGSTVRVTGAPEGDCFRFSIIDQGRGIPQAKLEAIFERFSQVDASDSRDKGGTGLGLAISRSIVAAHGGRIWVESSEAAGSAFHFTVPLRPRSATEQLPRPEPADPVIADPDAAHRILLIDDDADLARVVAHALRDEDFAVTWAPSAAEAMETLNDCVPALIILDLVLPDRSGIEVIEQMRRSPELRATPVLVYSAFDVGPAHEARLRLGGSRFLTKSRVSLDELVQTVLTLTGRPKRAA